MTFGKMTFGKMTFGKMTFGKMTFGNITFIRFTVIRMTFSRNTFLLNSILCIAFCWMSFCACHSAKCHSVQCACHFAEYNSAYCHSVEYHSDKCQFAQHPSAVCHSAVCYSAIDHSAVCYSVIHHSDVCYSAESWSDDMTFNKKAFSRMTDRGATISQITSIKMPFDIIAVKITVRLLTQFVYCSAQRHSEECRSPECRGTIQQAFNLSNWKIVWILSVLVLIWELGKHSQYYLPHSDKLFKGIILLETFRC